jgi:hypothetical protein
MGREKGKYGLQPDAAASNAVRSITIRDSNQRKETAIGKAIRFRNMQRCTHGPSVNPPTKESIFRIGDRVFFIESLPVPACVASPEKNVGDISYCPRLISMLRRSILALLEGGDRRAIGRADQVLAIVSDHPELFPKLIAGL